MKFNHTACLALGFNIRIVDDAGRDVSAFIAPVVYFWLWIPGWLWRMVNDERGTMNPERLFFSCSSFIIHHSSFLFAPGWGDDLALIGWAAWLLIRDWRLANGATI